jgi:hypothetical protein
LIRKSRPPLFPETLVDAFLHEIDIGLEHEDIAINRFIRSFFTLEVDKSASGYSNSDLRSPVFLHLLHAVSSNDYRTASNFQRYVTFLILYAQHSDWPPIVRPS